MLTDGGKHEEGEAVEGAAGVVLHRSKDGHGGGEGGARSLLGGGAGEGGQHGGVRGGAVEEEDVADPVLVGFGVLVLVGGRGLKVLLFGGGRELEADGGEGGVVRLGLRASREATRSDAKR